MTEPDIIEAEVIESRTEIAAEHVHRWTSHSLDDGDYVTYCATCNLEVPGDTEVALAEILRRLGKLEDAANSQSLALNWLTENTAGLFTALAQMNAAGGPMALLGMMKGN